MWIFGIVTLFFVVGGIQLALTGKLEAVTFSARWDMVRLSEAYSRIVSPLAAFSVTSAVFLANLPQRAQNPQAFADVMALFFIAFIILVGTTVTFASGRGAEPNSEASADFQIGRRVLYILSMLGFFIGLSMSWMGLYPLLVAIELPIVAKVFAWVVLFSVLAGASRVGSWTRTLLEIPTLISVTFPLQALVAAGVYRLVLVPRYPWLWPPTHPALSLTVLIFAVATLTLAVDSFMVASHGEARAHCMLHQVGRRVLLSYITCAVTGLLLLWLSLVLK